MTPSPRILVILPNWLGDGVMATPLLAGLRRIFPEAHIAGLALPLVAPILSGLTYVNAVRIAAKNAPETAAWMRAEKFDLAILLPNSFRSAWQVWRSGIPRRIGYSREMRGWMLTDALRPVLKSRPQREADRAKRAAILTLSRGAGRELPRVTGFEPVPTIDYYLKLLPLAARAFNVTPEKDPSRRMELAVTGAEQAEAQTALSGRHIPPDRPLVVMVPGANFGSSKCWMPERFAEVALALIDPAGGYDATVLIASAPAEMGLVNAIMEHATARAGNAIPEDRLIALAAMNNAQGISLGALKEIVRRSRLMICNDTGPRHFAAAFNVPVVTLFGPTDPRWAQTYAARERQVRIDVLCGPCQLKRCPIDHRCMTGITVQMVMQKVRELWNHQLPIPESPLQYASVHLPIQQPLRAAGQDVA